MSCGFEVLEENLRATLSVFSRAREQGEVRQYPGVAVVCSAVRFTTFNAALLTAPVPSVEEFERRLALARTYFRGRSLPWSVWLCEDWLNKEVRRKSRVVMEEAGMRLLVEMPGMTAERLRPPARRLPNLDFRRVQDGRTREAFEAIMTAAFEVPAAISRQIYGAEQTWEDGLTGWVGHLDGCPVVTAATRVAGGVIGLYAVGTLPAFRGQGCAEAAVRHAIGQAGAATGITQSVLQSTAAGLNLYQKLGYRQVARYSIYASNW